MADDMPAPGEYTVFYRKGNKELKARNFTEFGFYYHDRIFEGARDDIVAEWYFEHRSTLMEGDEYKPLMEKGFPIWMALCYKEDGESYDEDEEMKIRRDLKLATVMDRQVRTLRTHRSIPMQLPLRHTVVLQRPSPRL